MTCNDKANDKKHMKVLYVFICIFCLLRPIFTMSFFVDLDLGGLRAGEIFNLATSYMFLITALFFSRRIKLDFMNLMAISLCLYFVLTLAWAPHYKEIVRLILPFSLFITLRTMELNENQLKRIIACMIFGFITPVVGSSMAIFFNFEGNMEQYWTGLKRYSGMYNGPHSLAHAMFLCIFSIFVYWRSNTSNTSSQKRLVSFHALILVLSFYNMYYSFTRTVFIGLFAGCSVYLFGLRKFKTIATGAMVLLMVTLYTGQFQKIFIDVYNPIKEDKKEYGQMGSGRVKGWNMVLENFASESLEKQITGLGISIKASILGKKTSYSNLSDSADANFSGSHNDWLGLLVCFGFIGFTIYLMFYLSIIISLLKSRINVQLKYSALAFLCAVAVMNCLSNSYIARFELAQYFGLFIGLFLAHDQWKREAVIRENI